MHQQISDFTLFRANTITNFSQPSSELLLGNVRNSLKREEEVSNMLFALDLENM